MSGTVSALQSGRDPPLSWKAGERQRPGPDGSAAGKTPSHRATGTGQGSCRHTWGHEDAEGQEPAQRELRQLQREREDGSGSNALQFPAGERAP